MNPEKQIGVLISSVSKKIPLVKAVRKAFQNLNVKGKIVGGDIDQHIIGQYFVDDFWQMPSITDLTIQELVDFCEQHSIKAIIPTRDGELSFYAMHKDKLLDKGICCLVSKPETIYLCNDKLAFYEFLKDSGFPIILTSESLNFDAPSYVVKQRYGAASVLLGMDLPKDLATAHAELMTFPIFQTYIPGAEYSIDLFISREGRVKGCVARKRDLVIGGESQVTTSVRFPELENLCSELAVKIGIYGHAVFQVIQDSRNGALQVVECNPRFGGASTLSIAMGLRPFEWFLSELILNSPEIPFERSKVEKKQIRYPEDLILT